MVGVSLDPKRRACLGEAGGADAQSEIRSFNSVPERAFLEREGMRGGVNSPFLRLTGATVPCERARARPASCPVKCCGRHNELLRSARAARSWV